MLFALGALAALLLAQTVYLLLYKRQVGAIAGQLAFIAGHESLKFVETQLKAKEIGDMADTCNRLLERQRELERRFARRNEEINATIVSLSHDIRTPLTSLDGYLQLATGTSVPEEQGRYVELARTRIRQIVMLVDELFLYTKLQNPEYRITSEPVDVADILTRTLLSFHGEFAEKDTEPRLDLPEGRLLVLGSQPALERLFGNLIRNYLDHGSGALEVRCRPEGERISFRFINGLKPGVVPQTDRVFERFYKADNARSLRSGGLGLSIVRSLLDKMGGKAEAELRDGQFAVTVLLQQAGDGTGMVPGPGTGPGEGTENREHREGKR